MVDVAFYHLEARPLDWALPRLLSRAVDAGFKVVVTVGHADRLDVLDTLLWTFEQDSFLPHGRAPDPHATRQPIWLTSGHDVPNGAGILVLVDGAEPGAYDLSGFERCLDLFNGLDEAAVAAARARWSRFKAAGHGLTYWQQSPEGRWEKKA